MGVLKRGRKDFFLSLRLLQKFGDGFDLPRMEEGKVKRVSAFSSLVLSWKLTKKGRPAVTRGIKKKKKKKKTKKKHKKKKKRGKEPK